MISGIGTDVFEVRRMKDKIEKDVDFIKAVFTEDEIEYCSKMAHSEQHYAARYAAKEAFMKALGTGWRYGMKFCDINIANDELGKPFITVSNKADELLRDSGVKYIHVSLSHVAEYVTAFVVLEK
jgi:holo-[acyl-carrier protein] synthase